MPTYEFEVILAHAGEVDTAMADRLYESGCDDGTLSSSDGIVSVGFAREADSLEEAVRSAIGDLSSAGVVVVRVEPTDRSVYSQINRELTQR